MIVVDANIIAYLYIEGDFTQQARAIYQNDPIWAVPYLWRSEFRNILTIYLRRGFLTLAECQNQIDSATQLLCNN